MTQEKEQAINILLQVAHLAQSKGILNLEEAAIVAKAVELLTPKQEETEPENNNGESKVGQA
jgi:hypothetical protein